jgi:hypothetical protein
MAVFVLFVALNENIFPFPVPAKLIPVFEFVQLNTVPVTAPVNGIAAVAALLQTTWSVGFATVGIGFTVIANV